jgi:ligand-binding SRPBCC domain-containing protein
MSAKIYVFRQEQWISRPIGEAFAFFSEACNLEAITPPWLAFKILSISSDSIREGTEIRYRLRLHGLPISWRTEIRRWNPPFCFVDLQRSGPYKLWHHTHGFEAHGDRTRMIDVVRYTLPFGILGRAVHALKVRGDVGRIFEYRAQRIEATFGSPTGSAGSHSLHRSGVAGAC